jgi:DNA-binding LacI/PurR family transcriptional regulator
VCSSDLVDLLMRRIEGEAGEPLVLTPRLIVRASAP